MFFGHLRDVGPSAASLVVKKNGDSLRDAVAPVSAMG
jgi:hypothetical protein